MVLLVDERYVRRVLMVWVLAEEVPTALVLVLLVCR